MNIDISVIVPVYNCEQYLDDCISSLLKQTFDNYELIFINDGSKDNSLTILNKYKDNPKVKVYSQGNKGAAETRNIGIKYSNGKYLMFVDSDDYVDDNYLETYYSALKDDDYDIVMGGYKKITNDKVDFIRQLKHGEFAKYLVVGPVCKLYKKEFIVNNNISFLNTNASEDIYFNLLAYSYNPCIKIIDNIGYYYRYNENSLSNTVHKGFNNNVDICKFVEEINFKNVDNKELHDYFIIRYLIWYLLYSGKEVSPKAFINQYNIEFDWLETNIQNYRHNKYINHMPSGEDKNIHRIIRIFLILSNLHLIKIFSNIYCKDR